MKKIRTTLSKVANRIHFVNANGKPQPANGNYSHVPDEALGQELDAYQDGNKLVKVIWKGEVYSPMTHSGNDNNSSKKEDNQQGHHQHGKNRQYDNRPNKDQNYNTNRDYARAPYNFIPQPLLSAPVTLPETKPERLKAFDRYLPDLLSGSITFDLETLTHAFFGGQHKDTKKTFILNGRAVIPAASLRGMLRAAVAIVSHGKFGTVDKDRRFYYRSNVNNPAHANIQAGLLKWEHGQFVIYPGSFREETARISLPKEKAHGPTDGGYEPRFGRWKLDQNNFLVKPKSVQQQKIWRIVLPEKPGKLLKLSDVDVETFKYDFELRSASFTGGDKNYKEYMNLLELARNKKWKDCGIPVFFLEDQHQRIFIGNTKGFRLPFSQSLVSLIQQAFRPEYHDNNSSPDFADGLFGTLDGPGKQALRGRIRIENAYGPEENQLEQPKNLGVLLSPKPSSGQLYLEQPKGINTQKDKQKNYGMADARLRGRKLYHHRIFNNGAPDYFTENPNKMQDDLNGIRTVKPKSCFNAKLHFMNLLPEELGALLWVLDLPEEYAHKLGMGKPLGLGSMKFNNIQLNVWATKSLYRDVFNDLGELVLPEVNTLENINQEFIGYKKAFEEYMLTSLHRLGDRCPNLWEAKNMQYYAAMLDTKGKDQPAWHRNSSYMGGINEKDHPDRELWRQKAVLPHAKYVRRATEEPFRDNANPYA